MHLWPGVFIAPVSPADILSCYGLYTAFSHASTQWEEQDDSEVQFRVSVTYKTS